MEGFQQILDKLDIPIKAKVKQKKSKRNNIDKSLPFSQEEVDKLEREMLGIDTIYNEPKFENRLESEKILASSQLDSNSIDLSSKILEILYNLEKNVSIINKKIELNKETTAVNNIKIDESPQPLEIIKLMISEVDNKKNAIYQLQTQTGIKEILLSEYYDMSKFITMIEQYHYSFTLNQNITFLDSEFIEYRNYLIIISQNLMANSFRFFEKSTILDDIINLGEKIKNKTDFLSKTIDNIKIFFEEIKVNLTLTEYKKQFFFTSILNDRGAILNSIIIIDEMLGEYIIFSARNLSSLADDRIQNYVDKITLTSSSRKAYYNFHKSVKDFFKTNFSFENHEDKLTFLPFKDSGNIEIQNKMNKLFNANKMNKSSGFNDYANLIERVRVLRNDLAHGNIVKIHKNINKDISNILIDFKYLAIEKDILK